MHRELGCEISVYFDPQIKLINAGWCYDRMLTTLCVGTHLSSIIYLNSHTKRSVLETMLIKVDTSQNYLSKSTACIKPKDAGWKCLWYIGRCHVLIVEFLWSWCTVGPVSYKHNDTIQSGETSCKYTLVENVASRNHNSSITFNVCPFHYSVRGWT